MEKYRKKKRDLHMVFTNFERYTTMCHINRSSRVGGVSGKSTDIIRDMYARSVTSVRAPVEDTDFFHIEVGLHQGSALSLFLFVVVLDKLSKSIQERVPWCLVFVDDIVLVVENDDEDTQITLKGQRVQQTTIFKLDRIRNDVFRKRFGVASILDKMKEGSLRWFRHVRRKQMTPIVRAMEALPVEGRKSRVTVVGGGWRWRWVVVMRASGSAVATTSGGDGGHWW
ncbi:uncharacterized protein LOC110914098 [Helianthus annuus]|uniref:uncharacterized protein LOC110914098 n=1 Tax=Helianthus annuus TaxID=4232 RepID=UPI000B903CE4|nr:uncharacterized protein LOC110914098 [Helianthus annuus]